MLKFIEPYFMFLWGAAYNVLQTLDGLGLATTNFVQYSSDGKIIGSYWSATEASFIILAFISIFFIILLLLLLLSAFIIKKRMGLIVAIGMILLPGLMNVWGLWPKVQFIPQNYVISGTGNLGDSTGYFPLAVIFALYGWCFGVIITDIFSLGDKFKNIFDHGWYALALSAGVFFVYNTGSSQTAKNLAEENKNAKQASQFFLSELKQYDSFCQQHKLSELASCKWAARTQQQLYDYIGYSTPGLFVTFGPQNSNELYGLKNLPNPAAIKRQIRQEIQQYNDLLCPTKDFGNGASISSPSSGKCIATPASYCNVFPDKSDAPIKEVISRPVALASECLIPTLVRSRKLQESYLETAKQSSKFIHYRWLFFLAIAFLIGTKIANTSTKMVGLEHRKSPETRITLRFLWSLIKFIYLCIKYLFKGALFPYRIFKQHFLTS